MELYEGGGVAGTVSSPDVNPALTFVSGSRLCISAVHTANLNNLSETNGVDFVVPTFNSTVLCSIFTYSGTITAQVNVHSNGFYFYMPPLYPTRG